MRARRSGVSASGACRLTRSRPSRRHTPGARRAGRARRGAAAAGRRRRAATRAAPRRRRAAAPGPRCAATLRARVAGRVQAAAATELSGLVLSRSQRGVLWTHNDSGDRPRVLARRPRRAAARRRRAHRRRGVRLGGHRGGPAARSTSATSATTSPQRDVDRRLPRARAARARRRAPGDGAGAAASSCATPTGARDAEALLRDPVSGALVVVTKSVERPRRDLRRRAGRRPGATTTLRRRGGVEARRGRGGHRRRRLGRRPHDRPAHVHERVTSGRGAAASASRPRCGASRARPARRCSARARARRSRWRADGRAFYTVPEGAAARRYAPATRRS